MNAEAVRQHAQGMIDALLDGRDVSRLKLSCAACRRRVRELRVVPDPRYFVASFSLHEMVHCCSVACADQCAARIAIREERAAKRDPRDKRQALIAALARALVFEADDANRAEAAE